MTDEGTVDVAVIQMRASPGDVEGNVARLAEAVRAHGPEVDLVVGPELANTGYDLGLLEARGLELAEESTGPTLCQLADLCQEVGTTLVTGFLEVEHGVLYDSLATITASGQISVYRKTHLYPAELAHFGAGDRLDVVATPAGQLGLMLCFEHAFPEVATTLALRGAQILVIPSAVPFGYEHLLTLRSRARAQDNQVFVLACNLVGHGFCGASMVAGPQGDVLASAGTDEVVLRARLDLSDVPAERVREPALHMRRPGLYGPAPR